MKSTEPGPIPWNICRRNTETNNDSFKVFISRDRLPPGSFFKSDLKEQRHAIVASILVRKPLPATLLKSQKRFREYFRLLEDFTKIYARRLGISVVVDYIRCLWHKLKHQSRWTLLYHRVRKIRWCLTKQSKISWIQLSFISEKFNNKWLIHDSLEPRQFTTFLFWKRCSLKSKSYGKFLYFWFL